MKRMKRKKKERRQKRRNIFVTNIMCEGLFCTFNEEI